MRTDLAGLFPWGGLRRGSTVSVLGSTSLLLALLAESTAGDSWAAIVGLPDVGMVAAAESGVAVDRLALVRHPGADHPAVVAALLDGIDLVVTSRARLTDAQARRLSARARHRGAVLLTTDPWPAADVELRRTSVRWSGIGEGYGHLAHREATIRSHGRGAAARPAHATLHTPRVPTSEPASPHFGTRESPPPDPRVPGSRPASSHFGTMRAIAGSGVA